jgi:hypothetical protein
MIGDLTLMVWDIEEVGVAAARDEETSSSDRIQYRIYFAQVTFWL